MVQVVLYRWQQGLEADCRVALCCLSPARVRSRPRELSSFRRIQAEPPEWLVYKRDRHLMASQEVLSSPLAMPRVAQLVVSRWP